MSQGRLTVIPPSVAASLVFAAAPEPPEQPDEQASPHTSATARVDGRGLSYCMGCPFWSGGGDALEVYKMADLRFQLGLGHLVLLAGGEIAQNELSAL